MIKENIPSTSPTSQAKLPQIVEYLQHLSKSHQRIWRELISYKNHYEFVFPSHDRLAIACNVHRNTVKNAINEFKRLGWIKTIRRYNKSLVYLFSSDFDCKDVQKAMSVFFITLALITPVLLQSPKRAAKRDCPLSIIKSYLFINKSQNTQEGYVVGAREEKPETPRSIQKKKDSKMSNNLEWSREVSELHKQMPLKDHGFAKLSAFPPEAIVYAKQRMPMVYKAQTPFQYFVKLCEIFCENNNLKPDWAQYKKLQEVMKVANQDDYVDAQALQAIIAEELEAPKYQQRGKTKDKAPDIAVLKARQEATNELIREREAKAAQPEANRDEIVAGIMAQAWSDSRKLKALEFL